MGCLGRHRALLFIWAILILSCYGVDAFKFRLPSLRQTNICANHPAGGFVENPSDCNLFFVCGDNGEALEATCPSNMVFNPLSKLCDNIENVPKCRESQTQALTPSVSANKIDEVISNANKYCFDVYTQEPESNALVFLANPQNCYQYFMCYHGQALVQECSTNLYWNSKIGKCDLPSNVQCIPPSEDILNSMQITTAGENTASSGDGSFSVCPVYGHHIFPHMERCDFFIYCVKGYSILQQCPFFHYFDVESARCKLRTAALCIKDLNLKFRKNTF